jgi:hypothetical protein
MCRKTPPPSKFFAPPLSYRRDFLSIGHRLAAAREKPVDSAFYHFSSAFFPEKLDENKNCGNHRLSFENGGPGSGGSHNHGRNSKRNPALLSGAGNRG